jgi:Ca2+-binding RTX toxin-like protein
VQIANGATLTVEAGVDIHGNGHQILVGGKFIANGTWANRIDIDNTAFQFGSDYPPGFIRLNQVNMTGGSFLDAGGSGSVGSFDLLSSKFDGVGGFYIWYPRLASTISKSLFVAGAGLSIGLDANGALTITDNTFVNTGHGGWTGGAMLQNWANYGNSLTVKGNNFFSFGQTIIDLPENFDDTGFNAEGNYLGTTSASTINTLILDGNDSILRTSIIDYTPFLTAPNPHAPRWTGPVAQWGTGGADTFTIKNTGDRIFEKLNQGIDTAMASVSYTLPDNVENLVLLGASKLNGFGNNGANTLTGNSGPNTLEGLTGKDRLIGGDGADKLAGGAGRDVLEGGTGADRFVFRSGDFGGKTATTADEIVDFNLTEIDKIDLRAIDANASTDADDPFAFIGTALFNGQSGQLRYEQKGGNTFVQGDLNGDMLADFWIRLDDLYFLTKACFVL